MRRAEPDTRPERIVGLAILCPACFLAFGGAAVARELLAWIGGVL